MAKIAKSYKAGHASVNVIQGEYDGKPTFSYTVQCGKFNKQTNKFEKTDFFNITSLRDLYIALGAALGSTVKEWTPDQQNSQPRTNNNSDEYSPIY